MLFKRGTYLLLLFLGFALKPVFSQSTYYTEIGGDTLNRYTAIDSIFNPENGKASVFVRDTAGFSAGDTVMVYCTKGSGINTDPMEGDLGDRANEAYTNMGRYSFLLIDSIYPPNQILLNNRMPEIKAMQEGESAQLIRVHSFKNAVVKSTLTAPSWDPDGDTGGVLVLLVQRTLELDAGIDMSGKGFLGASESESNLYGGDCASTDPDAYDDYFYPLNGPVIRAGLKGEGITNKTFDLLRGKGRNINGGGGGNALLSGGGGGSNYGAGGRGGAESNACDSLVDNKAFGGIAMSRHGYYNTLPEEPNAYNRVYLGGGGGTGTRIFGRETSPGGNGGGLVIIVANTIRNNGSFQIEANGDSVEDPVDGAGGGGGGGGAILLDVRHLDNIHLSAVGGDGGDTDHPIEKTGPGGGGGGGAYWISGTSTAGFTVDLSNGERGSYLGTSEAYGATDGGQPDTIRSLRVVMNGFIFNTVPDEYVTCTNQIPETLDAGSPWGGDGTYTYEWVDSTATRNNWQTASFGTASSMNFEFTGEISETTWYRRIVDDGQLQSISFRITVYVDTAITGNIITAPDTVCYNDVPEMFVPDATLDFGDPTQDPRFRYRWLSRTESSTFSPVGATDSTYQAGNLTETTYFAREVTSGACVDTSNALLVKVWPSLTNNLISAYDTICYDSIPGPLSGSLPANGDPSDYRYVWQDSIASGIWTDITGAEDQDYQPASLTETIYYRRIVFSGSDDACMDTSDYVEILNIPLITGNTIADDQTVCTNAAPLPLTGAIPGGGQEGEYAYRWESRTLSTDWATFEGSDGVNTDFEPGTMTGDTTWFRRVVGSGGAERNVCLDYSDSVVINVLPSITGNQLTTADAVKCQWDSVEFILQDPAAGAEPGGGATQGGEDTTRRYQWESALGTGVPEPGSWAVMPGEDQLDFTARPQLEDEEDYFIRRIVFSGPEEQCSDTATMQITVHTQISGNTIEPFDSVCFADTKELLGATPTGEPGLSPVYTWVDLDTGADIPGSDQEDYVTDPFNQLGQYHYLRVVDIGECRDTSNSMQITVMQLPGGRLTDDAFQACEQDTSFAIDLNIDQLSTYVVPWEVTLRNQVSSGIGPLPISSDGQLPVTLDIDSDSLELNYEIESIIYRSIEGRYECVSPADSLEGVVPVYVFRKPAPTATALENPICNTTMMLTVNADNGIGSWSSDPPGTVLFTPGSNESNFLASIPNDHDAFGSYQLIFRSEAGDCFDTAVVNARFDEQPDPPIPGPTPVIRFLTDEYTMKADSASAGIGTWEVISGGATVLDPNDPKTVVRGLSYGEDNYFRWTVANGVCGEADSVMVIYRNEVKRYNGFSPNGDLHNEYYIMQGLPYADEFQISFFNALGNIVRTITNETVDELEVNESLIAGGLKEDEMVVWDGRSNNGNLVPSGTYYFVLTLKRGTETYPPYKEYVVVERE